MLVINHTQFLCDLYSLLFSPELKLKILIIAIEIISGMLEQHLLSSCLWDKAENLHFPLFLPFLPHLKFK